MLVDWLLFPLVMLAVCCGCGLTVERIAGFRMWGGLLPAIGLILMIVVATLTTANATTAPWTTPLVVLLALVGYATSYRRVASLRPEPWPLAIGIALFAVFAAPVVLSGDAGFAGYFVDNDAAFHFALIDQLLAHGHDVAGLPSSSYQAIVSSYLSTSYPIGADVALGAVRPLVGQDIAWIFQPYLAVVLTFGGVALYELLRDTVRPLALRAAIAFVAAQAGLVYAFYLETSIKELASTLIITVMVVFVFATLRERIRLRMLAPLALTAVAALDTLQVAAIPWIALPLAVFAVAAGRRARHALRARRPSRRHVAVPVALAAVALVAVLIPVAVSASTFVNVAKAVLTNTGAASSLGNLPGPLPKWEILGIWPTGDFRFPVTAHYRLIYALIGVATASGIMGVAWLIRRRRGAPLLMVAGNGLAAAFLLSRADAYASAKVMMIFSLTAVLAAMMGAAALHDGARRVEGWALAAVLAGGVLWTNVLALENASIAPRQRFDELATIGARFRGQGPALYNLSDEFAVHFLRNEAPADPADGPLAPRPGLPVRTPAEGRLPWDPSDLAPAYLQSFRLLVLGDAPVAARPPANYKLVFKGRFYTVWKRTASPQVLSDVPFSSGLDASQVSCRTVRTVAAQARLARAQVAYALRPTRAVFLPPATFPPQGVVEGLVQIEQPGRYDVFLSGSFSQRLLVWVAKHVLGSVPLNIGPPGQYVRLGQVTLSRGKVPVLIVRPHDSLTPGETATTANLGPLVLVRSGTPPTVHEIAPDRATSLCGRPLDWLEVVRAATR